MMKKVPIDFFLINPIIIIRNKFNWLLEDIMKIGDKVIYDDEEYIILVIYNSDYCELKKIDGRLSANVNELVHVSQITPLNMS